MQLFDQIENKDEYEFRSGGQRITIRNTARKNIYEVYLRDAKEDLRITSTIVGKHPKEALERFLNSYVDVQ